jgi:hypothetical protein
MGHPSADESMHGGQKKRRSKHDLEGRDYKCEHCDKSYLSYPALYTHSKTKHATDPSPSKNTRGRPRKGTEAIVPKKIQDFFDSPERQGTTPKPFEILLRVIERLDKEIGWELDKLEEHPLAQVMERGKEKTCDGVLAEYCVEAAKVSNEVYFEKICATVLGYRECLNKYGWQKLFKKQEESKVEEGDHSPKIMTCLEHTTEQQSKIKEVYSAVNGAEKLPEIANEFVLLFAKEHELGLSYNEAIDITLNMCEWMYTKGHTKTKVALI